LPKTRQMSVATPKESLYQIGDDVCELVQKRAKALGWNVVLTTGGKEEGSITFHQILQHRSKDENCDDIMICLESNKPTAPAILYISEALYMMSSMGDSSVIQTNWVVSPTNAPSQEAPIFQPSSQEVPISRPLPQETPISQSPPQKYWEKMVGWAGWKS